MNPIKKRGFDTFSDDEFMKMLDDENYLDAQWANLGEFEQKGNWKVYDPELPCLKPKEDDWENWGRSLSLEEETPELPKKFGGGGGGGKLSDDDIENLQAPGKPIGCCNGKPYSNKKRCCCRRKSYNIETDFCCARDGCANFEVFGNSDENKQACVAAGGIVVLHEEFDYSAKPMLGWAKEQMEKKDTEEEIQQKYEAEIEERYKNYELTGEAELELDDDDSEETPKIFKGFGDVKRQRKLAYWKKKQKSDENSENSENVEEELDFGYVKSGESSKWKKSRKYWDKQLTSWEHLRSNLPNTEGEPDALESIIFNG